MASTDPNSIIVLIDRLEQQAAEALYASWDVAPSFWSTSQRLFDTLDGLSREVYDRVTQSGALVPAIRSVDVQSPAAVAKPYVGSWIRLPSLRTSALSIFTVCSTGLLLDAVLAPHAIRRFFCSPIPRSILPGLLVPAPPPPPRPRKGRDGSGRLEAVLVLGAQSGTPGYTIALELARRGFVVIVSVLGTEATLRSVEREGRGWVKAVPLDPHDATSFNPFVRSVTASLSLRFPLGCPGDAFVSDVGSLSLTGFVNALPLARSSMLQFMKPVEALGTSDVEMAIRETAGVAVSVLKAMLPMMRTSASRPDAPRGVILTLVPTGTASVSLPYHSLHCLADQALESLMLSLRREINSSTSSPTSGPLEVITERVGRFSMTSPSITASRGAESLSTLVPSLPHHLRALYAPALSRRLNDGQSVARTGTPPSRLASRVAHILLDPRPRPDFLRRGTLGEGTLIWKVAGSLPEGVLSYSLSFMERLSRWVHQHDARSLTLGLDSSPSPPLLQSSSHGKKKMSGSSLGEGENADVSSEGEGEAMMASSFVGSEEDWHVKAES